MAETTSPTIGAGTTAPKATKKGTPHSLVVVKDQKNLKLAAAVLTATRVEGRPALFEARDVTGAVLSALDTKIRTARRYIARIEGSTSDQKGATTAETAAKQALLQAAQPFQSGANQKLARLHPERLPLYGIGKDMGKLSRTELTTAIVALQEAAGADAPLPGVAQAQLDALDAAFQAWNDADDDQSGAFSSVAQTRAALEKLLYGDGPANPGIDDDRCTLQSAADGLWPPRTNPGIRREFKLQLNKRFVNKVRV